MGSLSWCKLLGESSCTCKAEELTYSLDGICLKCKLVSVPNYLQSWWMPEDILWVGCSCLFLWLPCLQIHEDCHSFDTNVVNPIIYLPLGDDTAVMTCYHLYFIVRLGMIYFWVSHMTATIPLPGRVSSWGSGGAEQPPQSEVVQFQPDTWVWSKFGTAWYLQMGWPQAMPSDFQIQNQWWLPGVYIYIHIYIYI